MYCKMKCYWSMVTANWEEKDTESDELLYASLLLQLSSVPVLLSYFLSQFLFFKK